MIEPEEYIDDGICAAEAIDEAAQELGLSEDDVWHIWKLGLELRSHIAKQVDNAPRIHEPKYEHSKVVDAWLEDSEVYAVVKAKDWAENLGFRVQIEVEDSHTDEPADSRPVSICPKCTDLPELKKATVKFGYPGAECNDVVEYFECPYGWSTIDIGSEVVSTQR